MQILLGLLSRDDNRHDFAASIGHCQRCFDCPAKSPSFVNITANTFVCTSCSGLLREFGHRIKSVGASTFTTAEIAAIAGGNSMARQIWMGTWSETENGAEPNGHDEHDMRIFLRQKYQLKRFYKEPNAAELAINMTANARSLPLVEKQISIRMVSSADHQQLPRLQMPPPIQSQSPVPSPQPIITPTHTAVETCLPASAAEPTRSTSLLDLQDEVADDFGDFQTQDPTPSPAATIAQAAQQVSTTVAAASSPQLWVADFGALSSTAAALAAAPTTLAKPDDGGQDNVSVIQCDF
ncbi:hypothetical protein BC831DRAFT_435235 [Entophlyctis helioformis]|nr:hypothetical protein BC831DRAFT_435235 [Entophlyctis helioformis]